MPPPSPEMEAPDRTTRALTTSRVHRPVNVSEEPDPATSTVSALKRASLSPVNTTLDTSCTTSRVLTVMLANPEAPNVLAPCTRTPLKKRDLEAWPELLEPAPNVRLLNMSTTTDGYTGREPSTVTLLYHSVRLVSPSHVPAIVIVPPAAPLPNTTLPGVCSVPPVVTTISMPVTGGITSTASPVLSATVMRTMPAPDAVKDVVVTVAVTGTGVNAAGVHERRPRFIRAISSNT
jgi:hypothetical protein